MPRRTRQQRTASSTMRRGWGTFRMDPFGGGAPGRRAELRATQSRWLAACSSRPPTVSDLPCGGSGSCGGPIGSACNRDPLPYCTAPDGPAGTGSAIAWSSSDVASCSHVSTSDRDRSCCEWVRHGTEVSNRGFKQRFHGFRRLRAHLHERVVADLSSAQPGECPCAWATGRESALPCVCVCAICLRRAHSAARTDISWKATASAPAATACSASAVIRPRLYALGARAAEVRLWAAM